MSEFNVLIGIGVREEDKKLFFVDEKEFQTFPDTVNFPHLLHGLGLYKSNAEASRAFPLREIPEGFSDHQKIGKNKNRVTILKLTKEYPLQCDNCEGVLAKSGIICPKCGADDSAPL